MKNEIALLVARNAQVAKNVAEIDWKLEKVGPFMWKIRPGKVLRYVGDANGLYGYAAGTELYLGSGWNENRDLKGPQLIDRAKMSDFVLKSCPDEVRVEEFKRNVERLCHEMRVGMTGTCDSEGVFGEITLFDMDGDSQYHRQCREHMLNWNGMGFT